jgi:hypothetical protein
MLKILIVVLLQFCVVFTVEEKATNYDTKINQVKTKIANL